MAGVYTIVDINSIVEMIIQAQSLSLHFFELFLLFEAN